MLLRLWNIARPRTALLLVASAVMITAMACGDDSDEAPVATTAPEPTATTVPTAAPEPTATSVPAAPEPDISNGEALFTAQGCSSCHSTGTDRVVGPGLSGLGERAGSRVDGKTDVEYVTQSIRSPNAFVVPDYFPDLMPTSFGSSMTEAEIADVVAYLLQLP